MVSNYDLRRRALKALKPILPIALLVSLCAELPNLLSQVASTLTQQPLREVMLHYLESDPTLYPVEQLISNALAAVSPAMLGAWALTLLAFVLTPFLNLGRLSFTLNLLRGQEGDVSDVLCRAPLFLKALGLNLYLVFKELLWALPGMAVMAGGLAIFLANPSVATLNTMTGLYFAGLILALVLMFRAYLHYAMADLIMADLPETGIRAAVRGSIDIMRYRKMALFTLQFSFFGWLLLANLAQSYISLISSVLGMTLGMAAQLMISVYMQTAVAAFYETWKPKSGSEASVPETDEDDEDDVFDEPEDDD